MSHSTVQAVCRRLHTAAARVRSQARSCGICGEQNYTIGQVIFPSTSVSPANSAIPPNAPYSLIILSPILYSLDTDNIVKSQKENPTCVRESRISKQRHPTYVSRITASLFGSAVFTGNYNLIRGVQAVRNKLEFRVQAVRERVVTSLNPTRVQFYLGGLSP
jgi:hypothetical protein